MILLALDQSSIISGWAVFKDNKLFKYGKITIDNKISVDSRLAVIRGEIQKLINTYKPDYVIFEDIQLQDNVSNNVQTFKVLAEVYGVISELLSELQIPHSTTLASSWKSTLGIKGRTRPEQKKNAQKYIEDKYNIHVIQDIVDAICIGEDYIKNTTCAWVK